MLGGHGIDSPKESVYSSVVSRESVYLAFLAAILNCFDFIVAYIQNAYSEAITKEMINIVVGYRACII